MTAYMDDDDYISSFVIFTYNTASSRLLWRVSSLAQCQIVIAVLTCVWLQLGMNFHVNWCSSIDNALFFSGCILRNFAFIWISRTSILRYFLFLCVYLIWDPFTFLYLQLCFLPNLGNVQLLFVEELFHSFPLSALLPGLLWVKCPWGYDNLLEANGVGWGVDGGGGGFCFLSIVENSIGLSSGSLILSSETSILLFNQSIKFYLSHYTFPF